MFKCWLKHFWFAPSSIVVLKTVELFGPSPAEVKANTWNSYSVYLSSLVTLSDVFILFSVKKVAESESSFL